MGKAIDRYETAMEQCPEWLKASIHQLPDDRVMVADGFYRFALLELRMPLAEEVHGRLGHLLIELNAIFVGKGVELNEEFSVAGLLENELDDVGVVHTTGLIDN